MAININISGDSATEVLHELRKFLGASVVEGTARSSAPPTAAEAPVVAEAPEPSEVAEVSQPASDVDELDAHGHPWDAGTYASTRTKTQDGLWRLKPGQSRPDPVPGFPKDEAANPASPAADGATEPAGSSQTQASESVGASQESEAPEGDEFAKAAAAIKARAGDVAENVPARSWTDADLGQLCNDAAVKLNDPAPIKALIAKFVPEGEVAHSRMIPADKREEFAQEVEAKAGIEYAG